MEKKTGAEIDILLGRPEDPAIVIILRYFEDRSWPQWNSWYPDDHIFFVQHNTIHLNTPTSWLSRDEVQYDRVQIEEVATTVLVMMGRMIAEGVIWKHPF